MMKGPGIAMAMITLVLLVSCSDRPAFDAAIYPEGSVWTYDDDLSLDFSISDTTEIYDLTLTVDHSTDYPWENLYIRIQNIFPGGDTTARPLSLELADKRGQWQGECSGSECTAQIDLQRSVYFPKKGNYQISIDQYMRQDSIPGVNALKLALFRSDKEGR